jgi:hypothetical protein
VIRIEHAVPALALCLVSLSASAGDAAGDASAEIEYLLETAGQSDCTFVRNGKAHSAPKAESHLRLKYRNGKKWIASTEQFIDRIASKSSWTGKTYYIDCPETDRQPAGDWMSAKLTQYRNQ